ncbi:MAG: hypothetical protein OXI37_07875 [Gammaproteobacteria bacterium]|nr:hypothetical protein [Gammaproteobacteria bacterium]
MNETLSRPLRGRYLFVERGQFLGGPPDDGWPSNNPERMLLTYQGNGVWTRATGNDVVDINRRWPNFISGINFLYDDDDW